VESKDEDAKVIPFARRIDPDESLAEIGSPTEEARICLALYGQDLDPADVTAKLGLAPSSSHRRGDRPGTRVAPYRRGAWFLELGGTPPRGPEALVDDLLERLPDAEAAVWAELRGRFEIQVRFGIFLQSWNRVFGLRADQLARLAAMAHRFEYDIYANGDE
jgi:hypothetical protein